MEQQVSVQYLFHKEAPYQRHARDWLHASVQSCLCARDNHLPRNQCIYVIALHHPNIAECVCKTECRPAKAC